MRRRIGNFGVLLAGTALLGALSLQPAAAAEDSLTITSWGGAYQESQRKAFFEPFTAKTGVKITEEEYNGEIAKIRAMVEAGDVTWDLVDVDVQRGLQGCDEGILEPLDYSKIAPKEDFMEGAAQDCAIANMYYSTIFAYDADKLKDNPPTKIADLFDLQKYPGKRALQKDPFGNLEFALLADGVPASDVYEVLRTPEGVDRAFKKLDTIKDQVVWWEAGAQPPQLLADGEVVMATAWNGRIYDAVKSGKNFEIVWDGQVVDSDMWAIPKGAKNLERSYEFIKFAMSPEVIAQQSRYISYGPTTKAAIPLVDPAVLPHLPNAPENMTNAVLADNEFWADNGDELRKRFNTWLAQ